MKDRGFTVIAVALDEPEAARPWIEAAKPSYPALIDRQHYVADLYHFRNVPEAVWIDEQGQIVRPPENAGSSDGFRRVDRSTGIVPPDVVAERAQIKQTYLAAVRDWILKGEASEHVPDAEARRRLFKAPAPAVAQAHAHFRLAQHLLSAGAAKEAAHHFAEASRLHPESWAIWRQAARKEPSGLAAGPEFWARVNALGDKPYYPPIAMKGMPGQT